MAEEYGTGGSGKTWIAEAPEPLALAERQARLRIQQDQQNQANNIRLARGRTPRPEDHSLRDGVLKNPIPDAGIYQPAFEKQYLAGHKQILDAYSNQNLPEAEVARMASEFNTKMGLRAADLRTASEQYDKTLSAYDPEIFDVPAIRNAGISDIRNPADKNADYYNNPNPTGLAELGRRNYMNMRGGVIGNKVIDLIGTNTATESWTGPGGGGKATERVRPMGYKVNPKTGNLEPDTQALVGLFNSQKEGSGFINSAEKALLEDPNSDYAIVKSGYDKLLEDGKITPERYDKAMADNRFAHIVAPQLGGVAGLKSRFKYVTDTKQFADELTANQKDELKYIKPPLLTYTSVRTNNSNESYKTPTYSIDLPPSRQKANTKLTLGDAYVIDPGTGKFRPLTKAEIIKYGGNEGDATGKLSLVPQIRLRGGGDFKAIDADGKEVKLSYQPNVGGQLDIAGLARAFDAAKGAKLKVGELTYSSLDQFLSNKNNVEVNPFFEQTTSGKSTWTDKLLNTHTTTVYIPPLYFPGKNSKDRIRDWDDYSTEKYSDIVNKLQNTPIEILNQYRGTGTDNNQY